MAEPIEFDQQLGPFYLKHEDEFVPAGFEESLERLADTLGTYRVISKAPSLRQTLTINHYDLTKYIQDDWDRVTKEDPNNPPRKGFFIAGKAPSSAAGRAAEDILLEKLLWRYEVPDVKAEEVLGFWAALDAGLVIRPKGVASDDIVVKLSDGSVMLVESKSSFKGSPEKYIGTAVKQLAATIAANANVSMVALALVDLTKRTMKIAVVSREEFLEQREQGLRQALQADATVIDEYSNEFAPLGNLLNSSAIGMWADRNDIADSSEFAARLRRESWRRHA